MKRTFVTVMPNHIGAFLKASRCFAEIGVNITRVSYNKAVDSHMLFIDAEGTADKLDEAARRLTQIGYLQCDESGRSVILLEFRLRDVPGSVTAVLELISEFSFNISYISSQETARTISISRWGSSPGRARGSTASLRRRQAVHGPRHRLQPRGQNLRQQRVLHSFRGSTFVAHADIRRFARGASRQYQSCDAAA